MLQVDSARTESSGAQEGAAPDNQAAETGTDGIGVPEGAIPAGKEQQRPSQSQVKVCSWRRGIFLKGQSC